MAEPKLRWISSKDLMEEWRLDECGLNQIVGPDKLHAYIISKDHSGAYIPIDEFAASFSPPHIDYEGLVPDMRFFLKDVEKFEDDNPEFVKSRKELSGKERREITRLRNEKKNWDNSIEAAVLVGIFCSKEDRILEFSEFEKHLIKKNFGELPDTTRRKIWGAIPDQYRKTQGRPKGRKTKKKGYINE